MLLIMGNSNNMQVFEEQCECNYVDQQPSLCSYDWVLVSWGGRESGTTTGYTIFEYSFINQMYILFI